MNDASPHVLEANLVALAARSPATAALVRMTPPRSDLTWTRTEQGWSARDGQGRLLCSARRPRDEARELVDTIDLEQAGGVAVLGFGVGHHVRELASRLGRHGAIFIYESDVGLLRAVLEREELAPVFLGTPCFVLTDAGDAAGLARGIRGVEGLLALGVKVLEHPAQRQRLGEGAARFAELFTGAIRSVRTTVMTTLMHAEVTLRNELMNLGHYAAAPGIADLKDAARGRPAIVVSAGPSLKRNIELLSKPGVRERFVIIAVQTVLKTLLARGIRPHFVTALDYHEISRRFYEGLTSRDVEGVTLVVEPKANPAILDAFPGAIRCPHDPALHGLLGSGLARAMGELRAGSTVAHLAYYFARYMGCDPVILVGQDLGFSDGQYYAAGAAIHNVWGAELNPFNTLEMLEWQRIVRSRTMLHRATDVLGRSIYTDEQMNTYRLQFERDFAQDAAGGLTIIDASEGGVAKQHTRIMPLAAALEEFAPSTALALPAIGPARSSGADRTRLERRIQDVRRSIWSIEQMCRQTAQLLGEMKDHQSDQTRVNRLIERVNQIRDKVEREEPAFTLVQFLNQTGTLKRVRADRTLELTASLDPFERQRRQIDRDIQNVTWLGDAARQLGSMMEQTLGALRGGPKITRDPAPVDILRSTGEAAPERKRVGIIIALDPDRGGLGTRRPIDEPFLNGLSPIRLLLERLSRCTEVDRVIVVSDDLERARAIVERAGVSGGRTIECVKPQRELWARRRAVGASRAMARSCWRGAIGNMSVFDEALCPEAMAEVMERLQLDAAVPIGADWCLLDPQLIDRTIQRHREHAVGEQPQRFTFTHAAPGLGVCVLERSLMRELSERAAAAGVFASAGGLLGYIPVMPMADPIAKSHAVTPDPIVRDAGARFIPDTAASFDLLRRGLRGLEGSIVHASAEQIASLVVEASTSPAALPDAPSELIVELCTGRLTSGLRGVWLRGAHDTFERAPMSLATAQRLFAKLAAARPDAVLTLAGAGDPMLHPELPRIVELARRQGLAAVHVRTDLLVERAQLDALLDSGVDVISVDLMADTAATYRQIMGVDALDRVRDNLEHLLRQREARSPAGGPPHPWIVPRLTRCDAAYEEIESFYDRWLLAAGAAVIDPLPPTAPRGGRIEALPPPESVRRRLHREHMMMLCDGRVPQQDGDWSGDRTIGDLSRDVLADVYRRWCTRRRDADRETAHAQEAMA